MTAPCGPGNLPTLDCGPLLGVRLIYQKTILMWVKLKVFLCTHYWYSFFCVANIFQADIPLAHRRYFYATNDSSFLAASWPTLNATCRFWACRFTRTDSVEPNGPPGYGPNCSAKDGIGNWTVHNVIPPDESAGVTNDSVYTNAAAAEVGVLQI